MYVFEIYAEGIFVTFPWWLENVKRRSKLALFFKWARFWNLISKKENNYVFWSKLSKLHKKDPILHVATTFSLKQGETRTSHGPIPHPFSVNQMLFIWLAWSVNNIFNVKIIRSILRAYILYGFTLNISCFWHRWLISMPLKFFSFI